LFILFIRVVLVASKKIQEKILRHLKRQDWPVTTDNVARKINVSWNTAQAHLLRLAAEGQIKYKRVGRQNEFRLFPKGGRND
jgi:Mn-dependent DtxR family transcriptional regulator